MMTLENQTDSTKNNIFEVALKLFSEKGFDAVGVQEIVDRSGITKPTLYYYYGNKKGIFEAIIKEKGQSLIDCTRTASKYEHSFMESLTKILKSQIDFAKKESDFFRLHCAMINSPENSEAHAIYMPVIREHRGVIIDFFINSTNEFGNMRGKEALYSTMFYSIMLSVALLSQKGVMQNDEETLFNVVHSFVYGVAD